MGQGIIKVESQIGNKTHSRYYDNVPLFRHSYKNYSDLPINDLQNYRIDGTHALIPENYQYQADGEGVDIVIEDGGSFGNNFIPDFLGKNRENRLQLVNWAKLSGGTQEQIDFSKCIFNVTYKNASGHAIGVASSAAGYLGGAAKGAHIYNYNTTDGWITTVQDNSDRYYNSGLNANVYKKPQSHMTSQPTVEPFKDLVAWHNAKMSPQGNKRPTIYVQSVGNAIRHNIYPTNGMYRGTPWTYNNETPKQLWQQYGIAYQTDLNSPIGVTFNAGYNGNKTNADGSLNKNVIKTWNYETLTYDYTPDPKQAYIDAGIHVFLAGGNQNEFVDVNPDDTDSALNDFYAGTDIGLDWDNWYEFTNSDGEVERWYYNRGKESHLVNAIVSGVCWSSNTITDNNPNLEWREYNGGFRAHGYGVGLYAWEYSGAEDMINDIYAGSTPEGIAHMAEYSKFGFSLPRLPTDKDPAREEHPLDPNFSTSKFNGTSSTAPFIAGIAACYLEKEPHLTPKQLFTKLLENSGQAVGHYTTPTEELPYRADYSDWRCNTIYNPYAQQKKLTITGKLYYSSGNNFYLDSTYSSTTNPIRTRSPYNQTTSDITLQLKDQDGNALDTAGFPVTFTASEGTLSNTVDNGDGTYTATYTKPSNLHGIATITANVVGKETNGHIEVAYTDFEVPTATSLVSTSFSTPDNKLVDDDIFYVENDQTNNFNTNPYFTEWSLEGDDADKFYIHSATTVKAVDIRLSVEPDAYTQDVYNVTAVAANLAGSDSVDLSVTWTDVTPPRVSVTPLISPDVINNLVTTNSGSIFMNLDENSVSANTDLARIDATDYSLPVSWTLNSSPTGYSFNTSGNSATIRLNVPLDFETLGMASNFTYDVADANGYSDGNLFVVQINNLDDTGPIFSSPSVADDLEIGRPAGYEVYTAVAPDSHDQGQKPVTFSLVGVYNYANYNIDSTTGIVTTTGAVTNQWSATQQFVVKAEDTVGNESFKTVTLAVVNPIPANITSNPNGVSIVEADDYANYQIFTATSNKPVTWSLVNISNGTSGTSLASLNQPNAIITISQTGVVTMTGDVDFETTSTLQYVVQATTSLGAVTTKTITHPVSDVYEEAIVPIVTGANVLISNIAYNTPIIENLTNAIIANVSCETVDGDPLTNVTYSLSGTNANLVTFQASNGELRLTNALDYEASSSIIDDIILTITGPAGQTKALTFKVTPVNADEIAPAITNTQFTFTNVTTQYMATGIFTVTATDADSTGAPLVFEIVDDPLNMFGINSSTGLVFYNGTSPLYNIPNNVSTTITVRVTDGGGNSSQQQVFAISSPVVTAPNLLNGFYDVPDIFVTSGYGYGHTDQPAVWKVKEVPFDNGTTLANGRLHIRGKTTANPTYENDVAVAYAAVYDSNNNLVQDFKPTYYACSTTTVNYAGTSTTSLSLASAATKNYSMMGTRSQGSSSPSGRWALGYSTASSNTGADNGIGSQYWTTTSPSYGIPLTDGATIPTASGAPYYYRESSQSSSYSTSVMRPTGNTTLPAQGYVQIVYFNSGPYNSIDEDDTLAIGFA